MAKQSKQKSSPSSVKGGKLVDRNLLGVNPKKEQFEPTPAAPMNQHKKMAGAC